MIVLRDPTYSERGYVAPTVYLRAGKFLSNYNYYSTLDQAISKLKYLSNQGGANVPPAGSFAFQATGAAQTFGINVDFYAQQGAQWLPISYASLRKMSSWPPIVFRMYTTDGVGPFFAVLNANYFGISATVVTDVSAEKLAALDSFYREVALLKYRYNSLISFLNILSTKPLNAVEQQIFNEGILLAQNMSNQVSGIQGIEITYSKDGRIGVPILLLIAIIIILAAATAWTVASIVNEKEKTRRINDAFELQKWVAQKKIEVAQMKETGQISDAAAAGINRTLDVTQSAAIKSAEAAQKQKSIFENIGEIAKWGVIGYLVYLFASSKKK